MPAISGQLVQVGAHVVVPRDWRQPVGRSGMNPVAFAFLVPVFVMALVVPVLCILVLRRRSNRVSNTPIKKPRLRRREARERLNAVTEVSNIASENISLEKVKNENSQVSIDSVSVSEKECAICLSTLHAPSPPEPAKIQESIDDIAATSAPPTPVSEIQSEQILKLIACNHEFHAECLVSWFVLRKTSCPICRAEYISKEMMQFHDDKAQENAQQSVQDAAPLSPTAPMPASLTSSWVHFMHQHNSAGRGLETATLSQSMRPPV